MCFLSLCQFSAGLNTHERWLNTYQVCFIPITTKNQFSALGYDFTILLVYVSERVMNNKLSASLIYFIYSETHGPGTE